jgi:hypothetical protein
MTRKEAFAKAEEEYRQARANTLMLFKEYSAAKAAWNDAQGVEDRAMRAYYHFVKPTPEAIKYEQYLNKIGLK